MGKTALLDRTRQLLEESPVRGADIDTKVRHLLAAEYLRRLGQYRRVDFLLRQKYGMTFDEFVSRRVVHKKEYTWDVESDAMEWEAAVSGLTMMERKIAELQKEDRV